MAARVFPFLLWQGKLPFAMAKPEGIFAPIPLWAELELNPYLLIIGALVFFGFMMLRLAKRTGRPSDTAPLIRTPRPADYPQTGSVPRPAELGKWEVELHELLREMSARVDSKLSALQQLVLATDERLATLDRRLEELQALLKQLEAKGANQD